MSVETHTMSARLEDSTPLQVIEGSLALDESWEPYAQATLRCITPASLFTTDPRRAKRVAGTLTRTVAPDLAPAEARPFNLHIRSRQINADGTTTLGLASDELLLADLRVTESWSKTGLTTVRQLVNWVFGTLAPSVYSDASFTLASGTTDATIKMPSDGKLPIEVGQSLLDVIRPYLQAKSLALWCDETGVWRLTPATPSSPGSVTLLATDRVTDATDTTNRDDSAWADGAIVKYLRASKDWKAGSLSIFPWAASIASASRYVYVEIDAAPPWPFDAAAMVDRAGAALGVYNRMVNKGRTAQIEAVSVYTAKPGQAATVATPATPAQVGVLQAVEWSVPQGLMRTTVRNLIG